MSEFPLLSAPDPLAAAVARADRAEAVVRLLVKTGGHCWARSMEGGGDRRRYCWLKSGHEYEWHQHPSGDEWKDDEDDTTPSPWTPDLIAARDEIVAAGEQGGEG